MKRKFFKSVSQKRQTLTDDLKKELAPIVQKHFSGAKVFFNRYPKQTMMAMFLVVALNFFLLLYLGRKTTSAYSVTDIYTGKVVRDNFPVAHNSSVPFSLSNFLKMKEIRDSLEYYRSRQHKSRADTMLLLRLLKKYEQLDTSFKMNLHEKN